MQNGAARVIDDFSEPFVNAAYEAPFKAEYQGLDQIAITAKLWLSMVEDSGRVSTRLSDGTVLDGWLHESLTPSSAKDLVGRLLDMKSAYKHFLIAPSSQWTSGMSVYNTVKGVQELYVAEVLPFGAVGSVYGFCRFSRALRRIGTTLFSLVWTNYVDDFTQLDVQASGDSAQRTAEASMGLLGWKVAMKPKKRKAFAKRFDALGVVVDFLRRHQEKSRSPIRPLVWRRLRRRHEHGLRAASVGNQRQCRFAA